MNIILEMLFDIEYKATDIIIYDLCDNIERSGIVITEVRNFDPMVHLRFDANIGISNLSGNIVVNRIEKTFEVMPSLVFDDDNYSVTYTGIKTKELGELIKYLAILNQDAVQYQCHHQGWGRQK